MPGKQAKILSDQDVAQLLTYCRAHRYADRNRVVVLLSVKAGLRAGEIAKATWDMVLTASSACPRRCSIACTGIIIPIT